MIASVTQEDMLAWMKHPADHWRKARGNAVQADETELHSVAHMSSSTAHRDGCNLGRPTLWDLEFDLRDGPNGD